MNFVMKKILFLVCVSIISCGSPSFDLGNVDTPDSRLRIVYFSPSTENARNVKIDMPIVFVFSESIDIESAKKGLVIERGSSGQRQNVIFKCSYNENEFMLQCLPESGRWELRSNYSVRIKEVKSKGGDRTLDKEYNFTFSTI